MKGQDFIDIAARWVAEKECGEPTLRSAVSRAYYGAFHCAQALFQEIGVPEPVSRENKHTFVQLALMNSGNPKAAKAGSLLGSLHEQRKIADYEMGVEHNGGRATAAVAEAYRIRQLLETCTESDHARMKSMILNWKTLARK